jgi:hypothetical protein
VWPPPRLAPVVSERLAEAQDDPDQVHSFAVVPIAVLDLAALHALAYAVSLGQPVLAVHISPTEEEAERFNRSWQAWGDHLPWRSSSPRIAPPWRRWLTTSPRCTVNALT